MTTQPPPQLDPIVVLEPSQDGDEAAFVEALIAAARDILARRQSEAMVHSSHERAA